jgi:hypothetical protein
LPDVEKALWNRYREVDYQHRFEGGEMLGDKQLYRQITRSRLLSAEEIFALLCDRHHADMTLFAQTLASFLCRPGP